MPVSYASFITTLYCYIWPSPYPEISLTNRNSSFEGHSANLMPSSSADHLCETDPNSGTGSSGGQVRFVNSTVRYHLGNGSSLWSGRTRLEKILIVLVAGLTLLASTLLIILGKTQEASNVSLTVMYAKVLF